MKRELIDLLCFIGSFAALGWLAGIARQVYELGKDAPPGLMLAIVLGGWLLVSVGALMIFRLVVPPDHDPD